jgi:hypothetical protein
MFSFVTVVRRRRDVLKRRLRIQGRFWKIADQVAGKPDERLCSASK